MPGIYSVLGGEMFRIRLIFAVALGRVYYHCHYVGDTIIGAIVGTIIGYSLKAFNIESVAVVFAKYLSQFGTELYTY